MKRRSSLNGNNNNTQRKAEQNKSKAKTGELKSTEEKKSHEP
jgi:hypothetical protein